MTKLSEKERNEIRAAKSKWQRKMRHIYPGFAKRKWASTGYRINHPQP